jgi:hypothetical protein
VRPIPTSVLFLALAASPALAQTPTAEDSAGVQAALSTISTVTPPATRLKENGPWVIIAKSFNSAPKSR